MTRLWELRDDQPPVVLDLLLLHCLSKLPARMRVLLLVLYIQCTLHTKGNQEIRGARDSQQLGPKMFLNS
jgi:hypothetical protein